MFRQNQRDKGMNRIDVYLTDETLETISKLMNRFGYSSRKRSKFLNDFFQLLETTSPEEIRSFAPKILTGSQDKYDYINFVKYCIRQGFNISVQTTTMTSELVHSENVLSILNSIESSDSCILIIKDAQYLQLSKCLIELDRPYDSSIIDISSPTLKDAWSSYLASQ